MFLTHGSLCRGAGQKSLLLLLGDEFSPTKCPLAKPVCLMLTGAFPNKGWAQRAFRRRGGGDGVRGCMCVWYSEE